MKNILIITSRYLPGFKDGGPVRTVKNLIDNLKSGYTFTVMCADRDMGDDKPYDNIKANMINEVDGALVYYCKNEKYSFHDILKLIRQNDLVYVCGMYNGFVIKSLLLNRLGLIKVPFVVAPMGTFSKGALAIKSFKKKVYFKVFLFLHMFKNVIFSVTSPVEESELRNTLKIDNRCFIAEDMPRTVIRDSFNTPQKRAYNADNSLKVVFISRICIKKNLSYAIEILSNVKENVTFHIYGIIEHKAYFEKCLERLKLLPQNITWKYMGELDSEAVPDTFSKYDVFLFPTLGENFGHVISEALSVGCIPVISDTTPWLDLEEKNCGYVIPLENPESFTDTITQLCTMTYDEKRQKSLNAMKYFDEKHERAVKDNGYRRMFDELLR